MIHERYIEDRADLNGEKVFLEFYAPRCSFCRAAEPLIERLSNEYSDIEFLKVNTDENPEAAELFGVRGLPTFVALSNENELGRLIGARPESAIRELIEKL